MRSVLMLPATDWEENSIEDDGIVSSTNCKVTFQIPLSVGVTAFELAGEGHGGARYQRE